MTRKRYHTTDEDQLRQAIAARLGQPADAEVTEHVMLLTLQRENLKALLRSGHHVLTSDIISLDGAMDKYVPRPPMQINVRFADAADEAEPGAAAVDGVEQCRHCRYQPIDGERWPRCPHCGWKRGVDENTLRLIEAPNAEPVDEAALPAPVDHIHAPDGADSNVVQLAQHMSDEEKQTFAVKRRQESRVTGGIDPGPPRVNGPSYAAGAIYVDGRDTRSISQFMRDVENAYR